MAKQALNLAVYLARLGAPLPPLPLPPPLPHRNIYKAFVTTLSTGKILDVLSKSYCTELKGSNMWQLQAATSKIEKKSLSLSKKCFFVFAQLQSQNKA